MENKYFTASDYGTFTSNPQDPEKLGWCPVGSVLPHGEKVSL